VWPILKAMFAKLRTLILGRREDDFGVFAPSARQIYRFWDGRVWRTEDPMELYARMAKVGPELSVEMKVAQSPSKDAAKAHAKMLEEIRGIFGVVPLKEGGLTQIETVGLLDHFLIFCEALKKNTPPPPTASAATSTTSAPPQGTSESAAPATANSSPSGSSESDSSTGTPGPSPSEATSPSATSTPE
jgi:hypothetical protein